jgi:hypothetical protein
MLNPLQKANVSDRIDEICRTKEMITQTNVSNRYGEGRGMGLVCRPLYGGSGNEREATGSPIILIQGECDAQRI